MSRRVVDKKVAYNNAKEFIETTLGFECLTDIDEFYKSRKVSFSCEQGHVCTLDRQSYNNKRDAYTKGQLPHFCKHCKRRSEIDVKKAKRWKEIEVLIEPYGHKILSLHDDLKQMKMDCGNCGHITTTNFQTVYRPTYTGYCIKCQNHRNRKTQDEVRDELKEIGLDLLCEEYTSNKKVVCGCIECGVTFSTRSLHDIKRRIIKHYHCERCLDGVFGKAVQCEPLCFRCYCYEHPDEDIPFQFKMKEHFFRDALKEFLDVTHIYIDYRPPVYDTIIDNSCSRRRPDVLIDCYTHTIILELDENQHSGYSCENKRVCELFRDLGNRPLVVLRLNPDSYKTNGKTIKSCFYHKKGKMYTRKANWNKRCLTIFLDMLHHMNNIPSKEITVKSYYYSDEPHEPIAEVIEQKTRDDGSIIMRKRRGVLQYERGTDNLIAEYPSISEAARRTDEDYDTIRHFVRQKRPCRTRLYDWKLLNPDEPKEYSRKYNSIKN